MLSGCSVILNVIDLRNRKAACKGNDEQTFTFADAYGKIKKHRKRYVSYTKDGEDNRVLKIGRVYRMPRPPQQDSPQVDGLDNFIMNREHRDWISVSKGDSQCSEYYGSEW